MNCYCCPPGLVYVGVVCEWPNCVNGDRIDPNTVLAGAVARHPSSAASASPVEPAEDRPGPVQSVKPPAGPGYQSPMKENRD